MKGIRILVLIIVGCLSVPVVSLAARVSWNHKIRPRLQLSEAMTAARERLNAAENLPPDAEKYYCLSAGLALTKFKTGDWTFAFASEDGTQRWVILSLDKETIILKEASEY